MRHCVGSCEMYRNCGAACASSVLNGHEQPYINSPVGSYDYWDTCMDLYNNSVGKHLAGRKGSCESLCKTALGHGNLSLNQGFGYGKAKVDCSQWMKTPLRR